MHPLICSMFGLVGLSAVGYVIKDVVVTCVSDVVHRNQSMLTVHWAESHQRMVTRFAGMDVLLEELTETVVETIGPFVE
jgi:hypothetical protein